MYHKTLVECLRRIKEMKTKGEDPKKIGIMVASHNEDTVRFSIQKMKEIGIAPEDKVICFGQLLAMCDYITFPLGTCVFGQYFSKEWNIFNLNNYTRCLRVMCTARVFDYLKEDSCT